MSTILRRDERGCLLRLDPPLHREMEKKFKPSDKMAWLLMNNSGSHMARMWEVDGYKLIDGCSHYDSDEPYERHCSTSPIYLAQLHSHNCKLVGVISLAGESMPSQ